jgi:hypothetical protein
MTMLARKLMDAPAVAGGPVARDGVSFAGAQHLSRGWGAGSNPTDGTKFTHSLWFEVTDLTADRCPFTALSSTSPNFKYVIDSSGVVTVSIQSSSGSRSLVSSSSTVVVNTKYFLMVVLDTTQASNADRLKVWFGPYEGTISQASWTGSGTLTQNSTFAHGEEDASDAIGIDYSDYTKLFVGKMADVYWLDGVTLADPSSLVDSYASNAKPSAYSGSYGDTGYHLDFDTAGSLGADASGNGRDFSYPILYYEGSVLSVSTRIGSGTGGGGLAAAFDGTTNQAIAACASLSGNNAIYVGADFGSGTEKRIWKAEIWGSNDNGYVAGANPSVTLTMRSNSTSPGSATTGTSRGTVTFTDTANESGNVRTITSSNNTSAFRYWHIATGTHNANKGIAEIKFYESLPGQITSSNHVTPYL